MNDRAWLAASVTIAIFGLPTPAFANAMQDAVTRCQDWAALELPDVLIEIQPGLALANGTYNLRWQGEDGLGGLCRVTQDGTVLEFTNPYAVPRGERPIESIVHFQTDAYVVRVVYLSDRPYISIYNRQTSRVELNQVLAQKVETETETTYTNAMGIRRYQVQVSPTGDAYRLQIQVDDRTLYEAAGETVEPQLLTSDEE